MTDPRRGTGPAFLAVAMLLSTAGMALADETVSRSFPFRSGDRLEVEVEGGEVVYEVGGSGEILVEVVATRGQVSDYLDLSFEPQGDGLRIEGEKVGDSLWSRMFGGGDTPIRFRIVGPESVDMKLSTAGGNIHLDDLAGRIRVATSGGNIEFGSIDGEFKAATSGGDIRGDLVTEVGSVATSGGDIDIREGGGDLTVATSGGDIEVEIVRGELEAATSGGDILLGEIEGDLSARTSGGNIQIESSGGSVNASTSGGHVRIGKTGGETKVSTSGGDVVLTAAEGDVIASTSGGDLDVTLASDRGAELSTSGGTLIVHLPAGAGFDLDADANGGRFRSSVSVSGTISEDRAEGTIRGGGNLLRLRNRKGDIRIDAR